MMRIMFMAMNITLDLIQVRNIIEIQKKDSQTMTPQKVLRIRSKTKVIRKLGMRKDVRLYLINLAKLLVAQALKIKITQPHTSTLRLKEWIQLRMIQKIQILGTKWVFKKVKHQWILSKLLTELLKGVFTLCQLKRQMSFFSTTHSQSSHQTSRKRLPNKQPTKSKLSKRQSQPTITGDFKQMTNALVVLIMRQMTMEILFGKWLPTTEENSRS